MLMYTTSLMLDLGMDIKFEFQFEFEFELTQVGVASTVSGKE